MLYLTPSFPQDTILQNSIRRVPVMYDLGEGKKNGSEDLETVALEGQAQMLLAHNKFEMAREKFVEALQKVKTNPIPDILGQNEIIVRLARGMAQCFIQLRQYDRVTTTADMVLEVSTPTWRPQRTHPYICAGLTNLCCLRLFP
ncbi:unnamed protein product [Choristocarpus tenellus]